MLGSNEFSKTTLVGRTPLHFAKSKLRLLQQSNCSENSAQIKNEVFQVVEMMLIYLQRSGKNDQANFLSELSSRLHLHQTKEEVCLIYFFEVLLI